MKQYLLALLSLGMLVIMSYPLSSQPINLLMGVVIVVISGIFLLKKCKGADK